VISVLIVDDQDLVREGLRMLLEAEPDLLVAGEAADGGQALAQAGRWPRPGAGPGRALAQAGRWPRPGALTPM
jgi:CheY-like chemotaxis protein